MSNTFLTPSLIAPHALANFYANLVMVPLVYTDISSQFTAQKAGNTINVRRPTTFTANNYTDQTGIVIQPATENNVPVTLSTIADVSFEVTSTDMTLSIVDFDAQLLTPACMALAEKVDQAILGLRSSIANTVGTTSGYIWNTPEALIDAGRVLDQNNVPTGAMRHAVIGPVMKANWLNSQNLKYVLNAGDNADLRDASLGTRLFGFDTYQTTNVAEPPSDTGAGLPTTEVGVAFHETAFCFASAPLELLPGSFASVQTYNGLSIRVTYQSDINHKRSVISLDTLFGVTVLDANRACLIQGALTAS